MKKIAANAALLLATTLFCFLFLEAAVRLLGLMAPAREAALERRDSENVGAGAQEEDAPASRWMIHPYRGITTRPGEQPAGWTREDRRNNVFGVVDAVDDPRQLSEEDVVVAIFGGSVAMSTALETGHIVARELEATGWPDGREVQVVNFAIAGYKQPQQLFLLSEALLLGVPIDVVINLDGFNEVAIGGTDAKKGHHPFLPNKNFWATAFGSATGSLSLEQIELTAASVGERRRAKAIRAAFETSPLRHSALYQAYTGARAARADATAVQIEEQLQEVAGEGAVEFYDLENPCLGQPSGCWDLILDLWQRSSLGMKALAESRGASYFHALQPNQYLEGSKTLNDEELRIAWDPRRPWSQAAAAAYPSLREAGAELEEQGVRWLDLTQIFAGMNETLYKDPCCHYKTRGYFLIAQRLGRTIGEQLLAEGRSPDDPRQHREAR